MIRVLTVFGVALVLYTLCFGGYEQGAYMAITAASGAAMGELLK